MRKNWLWIRNILFVASVAYLGLSGFFDIPYISYAQDESASIENDSPAPVTVTDESASPSPVSDQDELIIDGTLYERDSASVRGIQIETIEPGDVLSGSVLPVTLVQTGSGEYLITQYDTDEISVSDTGSVLVVVDTIYEMLSGDEATIETLSGSDSISSQSASERSGSTQIQGETIYETGDDIMTYLGEIQDLLKQNGQPLTSFTAGDEWPTKEQKQEEIGKQLPIEMHRIKSVNNFSPQQIIAFVSAFLDESGAISVLTVAETITILTGDIQITIPANTHIFVSGTGRQSFDLLGLYQRLLISSHDPEAIFGGIQFGISGVHLQFSQPLEIVMPVQGVVDGKQVQLLAKHEGQMTYSSFGLSSSTGTFCREDGSIDPAIIASRVEQGKVRFFTCGASRFIVDLDESMPLTGEILSGKTEPTTLVQIGDENYLFTQYEDEEDSGSEMHTVETTFYEIDSEDIIGSEMGSGLLAISHQTVVTLSAGTEMTTLIQIGEENYLFTQYEDDDILPTQIIAETVYENDQSFIETIYEFEDETNERSLDETDEPLAGEEQILVETIYEFEDETNKRSLDETDEPLTGEQQILVETIYESDDEQTVIVEGGGSQSTVETIYEFETDEDRTLSEPNKTLNGDDQILVETIYEIDEAGTHLLEEKNEPVIVAQEQNDTFIGSKAIWHMIHQVTSSGNSQRYDYSKLMDDFKKYFLENKSDLENLFGTGVSVGNKHIDFAMLSGHIPLQMIFRSINTLEGNLAEVAFDPGTILKTENGNVFTGTFALPEFLDTSVASELSGQKILSVLDIGVDNEKIVLEDKHGGETSSKIKIPTPGQDEGTVLDINYSHDGSTWTYLGSQKVFLINGSPYVEFETTHFTLFSIGIPVGSFFINNNDQYAYSINVTLNSDVPGATHMRFANTQAGLTGASWVTYATGYAWTITDADDVQNVYAQFSGSYGIQSAQDSIFVVRSDTNLQVLLAGNMTGAGGGTIAIDSTSSSYHFTGVGVSNVELDDGEEVFVFNGLNEYLERGSVSITNYPFTFSAWIRPESIAGTDSIMMIGNSASTSVYRGIQLVNGAPSIVGRNTTARVNTDAGVLSVGTRYHIVGVFNSATSRVLYLNGDFLLTGTQSVNFSSTNQQVRVGRYISTTTNYFDGYMDGIRIYDKALSSDEIITLYESRTTILPEKYISVGSFNINNDDRQTYITGVTLYADVPGATHMRFSNTQAGLTGASWVTYTTGYARTMENTGGNHFVYAEFSGGNGWRGYAQDNIFVDIPLDSSLIALLPGTLSGTTIIDRTSYTNHFTGFGGIQRYTLGGEQFLSFNSNNQYLERGSVSITNYPFTFSVWIRPESVAGTHSIMMIGNSASTSVYRGIQLVNGAPSIVGRNTTARTNTDAGELSVGTRYHIVGVFNSATSRVLYLNGNFLLTGTQSVNFSSTNQQVRVGRYISTSTNYFDGYMDDIRIYNTGLSSSEITSLYQTRVDRQTNPSATVIYDIMGATEGPVIVTLTGYSESITILNNSGNNTYEFTGNTSFTFFYKNSLGNIGSTVASVNWITPPAGSLSITCPTGFVLGSTGAAAFVKSLEKILTGTNDYFDVVDGVGIDTGYYTTLTFSDLQYNSHIISKNNMYVKTSGGITLRAGAANSNVVTAITGVYLEVSSPLTFIKRDAGENGQKKGTYGAQIVVKINIPAYQSIGSYTGTIAYTLYEN